MLPESGAVAHKILYPIRYPSDLLRSLPWRHLAKTLGDSDVRRALPVPPTLLVPSPPPLFGNAGISGVHK